jgi:hypothetical protein
LLLCVVADKTAILNKMVKKTKVVLNLRLLSVPDKIAKSKSYVTALTGNANFPNASANLEGITTAIAELDLADGEANAARDISVTKTAIKNQKEEELDFKLTALAGYVEGESKGDEAKIKSAGMDIKAGASPIGVPATPSALSASEGAKTGTINLKWKSVRGAKSFLVRITEAIADNNSWKQSTVVTKANAAIDGLTSGKQYWFQVGAVGAAGQGAWSDPAVKVAP